MSDFSKCAKCNNVAVGYFTLCECCQKAIPNDKDVTRSINESLKNIGAVLEAEHRGFMRAVEMATKILKDWDTSWYEEDTKLAAQLHDRITAIQNLKP